MPPASPLATWLQSPNTDPLVAACVEGSAGTWPHWPSPAVLPVETPIAGAEGAGLSLPFEKSLRMLAAVVHRLERAPGFDPSRAWFRQAAKAAAADETGAFLAAWRDPQAFHWARKAWELLGDPAAATDGRLDRCLARFQLFPLAAAQTAGRDLRLARPLAFESGLGLPGGRWSIRSAEPAELRGTADGLLEVRCGDRLHRLPLAPHFGHGPAVEAAPTAVVGTYELPLNPWSFALDGLDFAAPLLAAGRDFQERQRPVLEGALSAVERFAPDVFAEFRRTIRLAAFKPRSAGGYDDFSHPELPGAFAASAHANPLELGDHLIHEFRHNRMSLLEESGPMFAPSCDAEGDCRFYSPWREKTRGLYGIFHGVYVFISVTRYWGEVFRAADTPAAARPYVTDRLLRLPLQLALACDVLRHAEWTALGAETFARMEREVAAVRAWVGGLGLPADAPGRKALEDGSYAPDRNPADGTPSTVLQSLADHWERNDRNRTCALGARIFSAAAAVA